MLRHISTFNPLTLPPSRPPHSLRPPDYPTRRDAASSLRPTSLARGVRRDTVTFAQAAPRSRAGGVNQSITPDYSRLERELQTIRVVTAKLLGGAVLTKHRRGIAQRRYVWLSDDCRFILWGRVGKSGTRKVGRGAVRGRLNVDDVVNVRLGTTAGFAARGKDEAFADRCFYLTARGRTLNLEVDTEVGCHEWYDAFRLFVAGQSSLKISMALEEQSEIAKRRQNRATTQGQRLEAPSAQQLLVTGGVFLKHKYGKWHTRAVWCDPAMSRVFWGEPGAQHGSLTTRNKAAKGQMPVSELVQVHLGTRHSPHFGKNARGDCSFTVVSKARTLDLEAEDPSMVDLWAEAFWFLITDPSCTRDVLSLSPDQSRTFSLSEELDRLNPTQGQPGCFGTWSGGGEGGEGGEGGGLRGATAMRLDEVGGGYVSAHDELDYDEDDSPFRRPQMHRGEGARGGIRQGRMSGLAGRNGMQGMRGGNMPDNVQSHESPSPMDRALQHIVDLKESGDIDAQLMTHLLKKLAAD